MKAIHNCPSRVRVGAGAVNYTQRYKKWKQFTTPRLNSPFSALLWTIHKDTKNESNSQLGYGSLLDYLAVNYTQRYKKWKQFTTYQNGYYRNQMLWTIHKDTKNESNSQPFVHVRCMRARCELYTKIQKMKAIHNILAAALSFTLLWTIHKDTKNESNSQQCSLITPVSKRCELYTKIQKMKAIHNNLAGIMSTANAVNYTQRYNN